ncbi:MULTISPECIES: hybrid sensor histidine kinase/response regulator [Pseudoalteromonas]|uniref:hybrid sensor histidine kinase/response regulator n=1 Tax=Pseudoalteromonas TaxID=53246 RepID=UPI0016039CC6|nr:MULTISPECIES: hybrid sensor histidine kinase/response regulator [Pseudoalteromonas]MBB1293184.1 response regulator [Pseudoalteromonas sp. SR41-4]MBB1308622.1 response regulator [Pseudoalteromonas sp. SR41-8]MBB1331619.1 response regulator [Pseudoalteromonas sp. SR41-6]MBB1341603.1 response regulator [Pseudoalteromonas sp. SR45-6]MBB1408745.1 response regulator [Pseudoalteromonas sp. SG44-17]
MRTSKLSIRLLWYITPLVILPLLFLGGFTLTNVTSSTQKQAELIVSRFVEQQQQKMFNYIDSFHSTTKLLSASPVLSDFLADDLRDNGNYTRRLGALMDVFASYSEAYPDIVSVNLVSPDGQSDAYYSSNLNTAPTSYPFFSQVLQSNLRQQQFMVQKQDGTTSLYFIQRIYSADYYLKRPQQLGFIVLHVEPSILNTSILEAPYNNTLNLLLTSNGKILFSSDYNKRGQYISEYELQQIHDLADLGKLSTIELSSIDKVERMIYAIQMSGGYYYVSTIPKALLYQSGKAISLITALIVIISVITLPMLIFIVVRNLLLNPIELLGAASHRVGDGDLSVYLPAHNNDEVGVLFNDFNHMVNQIRHYQDELEEYKHHLEDKVESRTKALETMNSQLEVAIAQAEQANQLKSRFLANMSHEIRTPLTAIMGFTEQLLHSQNTTGDAWHLNTILRNSKHLLELINNILDLSKIEAEKLAVEKEPLDIVQLVHDIDSIIRPLSQEKKLNCNINFHLPLPRIINSDSTRLKQILINIASNAVKFTEQGLIELDITYNSDLQLIEFAIKDSGIGMSEREVERVFKPFEQADTTTTRRFGGTGLGLCISKNLAQLLGGDVYVTSTPGQGSCFCVQIACNLPADKQQTVPMLTELSQLTPAKDLQLSFAENSFDANILVAEDNPDNQVLIKLLLQTWGLEPDIANNGAEAVEMALVNDYQLIIMDMQMPVMGGLEATQMLRHAAYDGPIIALTANVMKDDVNTYLQAGCDEALAKPIDKDALESVLVSYLNIEKDSQNKWDSLLNSDKFQQINDNYRLKLPGYLTDVTQLYNNGEWEQLRALAHSLKGSAGCFGFSNIHHAAATLEDNLRGRDHNRRDYLALSLIEAIKYTLQQEQSLTKK